MTEPVPLNYSPDPPPPARWGRRVLVVLGLLVVVGLVSVILPVDQIELRMDAVTGTMVMQRTSFFGLSRGSRTDVSSLERELTSRGIAWTPDWRLDSLIDRNVFGRRLSVACGTVPEIYSVDGFMGPFATAATDDELREFVRVMQSGTAVERKSAVNAAAAKGMPWLTGASNGTPRP